VPVIGIGVDLVDIDRVERMLADHGERILTRLFTAAEVEYCSSRAAPARHYAARLAAKEAGFKALAGSDDARTIGWKELEVLNSVYGVPALRMFGRAQLRAEQLGVGAVHLSLTHGENTAVAFVVMEREET
jgi:holo-[acyl-carrier protein] synthase